MMEVEESEVNLGFSLTRSQLFSWFSTIQLFPYLCQFLSMNFFGLMHILIVSEPNHVMPVFSMFQYVRELENFSWG